MSQLKKMIKDTQNKIDGANSNFCSTPTNPNELAKQVAKTLILGQGNVDDLLSSVGKKVQKKYKDKRCF